MLKELKINNGISIFDAALLCYNDASLVYLLISENTNITDVNMDLNGLTLVYTPKDKVKFEANQNTKKVKKFVTISQNQSLFDLSLQHYGSVDFIYELIKNNSFIENILTEDIETNLLTENTKRNYVNNFYDSNKLKIATKNGSSNLIWDGVDLIWDGIDYLAY